MCLYNNLKLSVTDKSTKFVGKKIKFVIAFGTNQKPVKWNIKRRMAKVNNIFIFIILIPRKGYVFGTAISAPSMEWQKCTGHPVAATKVNYNVFVSSQIKACNVLSSGRILLHARILFHFKTIRRPPSLSLFEIFGYFSLGVC